MLLIGTSGFSYADWKDRFYPPAISDRDMLAFYSQYFPACEINFSYYRIPDPAHTAAMVRKSGRRVTFVVKAHQTMTHTRDAGPAEYGAFNLGVKPMLEAGVLGGILAQFPYSFSNNLNHRTYLADLKARLGQDTSLIVEFRHHTWNRPDVFELLHKLSLSYVNVDEPALKELLPATSRVTGPVGYVRFHGRNRATWFKKNIESWERYNYLYSEDELREWVPRIRQVAGEAQTTFVFFNNHWQSQAVTNARQMAELLECRLPETCATDLPEEFQRPSESGRWEQPQRELF